MIHTKYAQLTYEILVEGNISLLENSFMFKTVCFLVMAEKVEGLKSSGRCFIRSVLELPYKDVSGRIGLNEPHCSEKGGIPVIKVVSKMDGGAIL